MIVCLKIINGTHAVNQTRKTGSAGASSNRCPGTILGFGYEISQELRLDNQQLELKVKQSHHLIIVNYNF